LYTVGLAEEIARALPHSEIYLISNKDARPTKPLPSHIRLLRTWSSGPRFVTQVFRTLTRIRPEVVHIQHEFSLYGGPLSVVGFPLLLILLRLIGLRPIVTMHGVLTEKQLDSDFHKNFFTSSSRLLRPSLLVVTFFLVHAASLIIVHSRWQGTLLEKSFRVPKNRIRIIRHGTWLYPSERCLEGDRDRNVTGIFFGYITPSKGLEFLIKAFSEVRSTNLNLSIIGGKHRRDSGYYMEIRELCKRRDNGRKVDFLGYLPEERVHDVLSRADFAVFPYTAGISVSGALCIAIGHGLPMIATKVDSFSEYLDYSNSLMIGPGDTGALRQALEMLANSPDLRHKLSDGSIQLARQISWQQVALQTVHTYREVADVENV